MNTTDRPYYDLHDLLTRNGVYNFVVGGRGTGKTYAGKKMVIRNAINKGQKFIYLRRYKPELANRASFFTDIAHEFPEWVFRVNGMSAQMKRVESADDNKVPWETIGYFLRLSGSQQVKSVPFPDVYWILFDEFIIEKGLTHYLPNEAFAFNDFYSTVDRFQDRVRVLFMANSISIMNPYFMEYGIQPKPGVEWVTKADGFVVAQFADDEAFKASVYQTRFGRFIKESDYGDYSVEGSFTDNSDTMLGDKPAEYSYMMTIVSRQGKFSVWLDRDLRKAHISERQPKSPVEWVLDPTLMTEDRILVPYNSKILGMVRTLFAHGMVSFSSAQARNLFIEIWRR